MTFPLRLHSVIDSQIQEYQNPHPTEDVPRAFTDKFRRFFGTGRICRMMPPRHHQPSDIEAIKAMIASRTDIAACLKSAISGHRRSSLIPGSCVIFDPAHQVAFLRMIPFSNEGTK